MKHRNGCFPFLNRQTMSVLQFLALLSCRVWRAFRVRQYATFAHTYLRRHLNCNEGGTGHNGCLKLRFYSVFTLFLSNSPFLFKDSPLMTEHSVVCCLFLSQETSKMEYLVSRNMTRRVNLIKRIPTSNLPIFGKPNPTSPY